MRYFILFLPFVSLHLSAQQQPTLFEPDLISDGGVFGFTLSPDAKEAFWVRSKGKRDTLVIMWSTKVKGQWQQPQPATFSGNKAWKDIDPVFSPDGKSILFQSNRPVESKPDRKGFDIWMVKKTKGGWSVPLHLGNEINSDESESFASMSNNGNIYFMKNNENGTGQSDIFVSRFIHNEYQKPENLGLPVNTNERESNPYIFPDENAIIYFSSDPKGLGDVDLYISNRKDGEWTTPKNLGTPINSALAEFCPFIHFKEKKIYFARQRKEGDRLIEDIYSYPFEVDKWTK
jgi:hypothetical protein